MQQQSKIFSLYLFLYVTWFWMCFLFLVILFVTIISHLMLVNQVNISNFISCKTCHRDLNSTQSIVSVIYNYYCMSHWSDTNWLKINETKITKKSFRKSEIFENHSGFREWLSLYFATVLLFGIVNSLTIFVANSRYSCKFGISLRTLVDRYGKSFKAFSSRIGN